jgi:hypothetical protein
MEPRLLHSPPFGDADPHSLSVVLQEVNVEVQDVIELRIEGRVVGVNAAVYLVSNPGLDMMGRIGRIPPQVPLPFAGVAMLEIRWLTLTARACAKQVAEFNCFAG